MPLGTGGEFVGGGGGGGGSIPSALVVGGPSSTGTLKFAGLNGSPDLYVPAGSGNSAYNDDFDGNTAGAPTNWTAFNAPDTVNTSDFLSYLHLRKNATGNN